MTFAGNAGTYTVRGSFAGNGNYTANSATKTIAITKAELTVKADDKSKTYNGSAFTGDSSVLALESGPAAGEDHRVALHGCHGIGEVIDDLERSLVASLVVIVPRTHAVMAQQDTAGRWVLFNQLFDH